MIRTGEENFTPQPSSALGKEEAHTPHHGYVERVAVCVGVGPGRLLGLGGGCGGAAAPQRSAQGRCRLRGRLLLLLLRLVRRRPVHDRLRALVAPRLWRAVLM